MSAGVDSVYHLGQTGGKRVEGNFVARNSSRRSTPASDGTAGVYGITVAAELAGMTVQALRLYERKGLLKPAPHRGRHPPVQRHRHRPATPHQRPDQRRHQPHRHCPGPRPGSRQRRPPHPQRRPENQQRRAPVQQHRTRSRQHQTSCTTPAAKHRITHKVRFQTSFRTRWRAVRSPASTDTSRFSPPADRPAQFPRLIPSSASRCPV